jgi:hypothetical protein
LYKTKEEHLANLNIKNLKAIQQYNNYFNKIEEGRESLTLGKKGTEQKQNHIPGWSFMKASQMVQS